MHVCASYWTESNSTLAVKVSIKNVAQFSIHDFSVSFVHSANLEPLTAAAARDMSIQLLSTGETVEWLLGFTVKELTRLSQIGFRIKVPPTQACPETVDGDYGFATENLKVDPLKLFVEQP